MLFPSIQFDWTVKYQVLKYIFWLKLKCVLVFNVDNPDKESDASDSLENVIKVVNNLGKTPGIRLQLLWVWYIWSQPKENMILAWVELLNSSLG